LQYLSGNNFENIIFGRHFEFWGFMKIRRGTKEDLSFLKEMLFEAFFWNPDVQRPDYDEFSQQREFSKLLYGWGRLGDQAIIAEIDNKPVGAAWYRFWTEENHSYGFVDENTPELGVAVQSNFRSLGIGRVLLCELIENARNESIKTLSLSVDPDNYAKKLYGSEGFVKVSESGTSWTLLLYL
jgi:ribosomal protein S18 acetylase RimI-like enzyme